jgi:hypothetical protein
MRWHLAACGFAASLSLLSCDMRAMASNCEKHSVDHVTPSGDIVELDDGTEWEVTDGTDVSGWDGDDVLLCGGTLIHTDDGERAAVTER